eukprot:293594-Amphidinium_carterae.1
MCKKPTFGPKQNNRAEAVCGGFLKKVQQTALRLIQFMHREWICVGRRPNGLCGAALLIATYYHGLRVSAKDAPAV